MSAYINLEQLDKKTGSYGLLHFAYFSCVLLWCKSMQNFKKNYFFLFYLAQIIVLKKHFKGSDTSKGNDSCISIRHIFLGPVSGNVFKLNSWYKIFI